MADMTREIWSKEVSMKDAIEKAAKEITLAATSGGSWSAAEIITRHLSPVVDEMKVQMGAMLRTIDRYEKGDLKVKRSHEC